MINERKHCYCSLIILYFVITFYIGVVICINLFDIKLIESNDSRLVATSNYNYALISPKLLDKNWKTVSVNGDNIFIISTTGEKILRTKTELGEADKSFIESLRDEIANSNSVSYTHASMSGGGLGGSTITSSQEQREDGDKTSFSSTSGFASSSISTNSGSSIKSNDINVNMKDDNNFSISKSNLPFNWSRVFLNGEYVTVVYKDGQVKMQPINSLEPNQLEVIENLRKEMKEFQVKQKEQISNTIQHSMDMVSNIFSNTMSKFPQPPDYNSAIGNTFGNNFPFGPNNSPFSSSSGWPFARSFAFAYRRK